MPQLNAMAMGFAINSLVALGVMSLSLGAMAWIFQEQVDAALTSLLETFRHLPTGDLG